MTHADIAQGMMHQTGTSFRSDGNACDWSLTVKGQKLDPPCWVMLQCVPHVLSSAILQIRTVQIANGNKEEGRCLVTRRDFNMNTRVHVNHRLFPL
jgi:hypothetical protein